MWVVVFVAAAAVVGTAAAYRIEHDDDAAVGAWKWFAWFAVAGA